MVGSSIEATWRAAVVTVSDGVSEGVREDVSGQAVAALLGERGFEVVARRVVPDERSEIEAALRTLPGEGVPLVVTTGGTGLGPRDVTPEATRAVIDREAPGLAEEMRASGRGSTPLAMLSRGVAGSIGETLIVNLPGSRRGAVESLTAILPALPHALQLLSGDTVHGPADAAPPQNRHPREAQGFRAGLEEELAAQRAAGHPVVVGTAIRVHGDPPCRVGQKILLGHDGAIAGTLGCAEFDDSAVADAPAVLASRAPTTRTYTHDLGSVEVFLDPIVRRPRLVVFSATPVALHLLRWGSQLGFDPALVESRAKRITPEHRAAASVFASAADVEVDDETAAVHTDHDAPGVSDSVAALLESPARFVAVMGSRRHVGPYIEELRSKGYGDDQLSRIRSPAGIDIGARTAEEIALSILAGIVADRHGAGGGWLDRPASSG